MQNSPHVPRTVLLIGGSLYLIAIEASLRTHSEFEVRRLATWQPSLLDPQRQPERWRPDVVIIDNITVQTEALAALFAAYPELTVVELTPSDHANQDVIVRYGERRALATTDDLARLIAGAARLQ